MLKISNNGRESNQQENITAAINSIDKTESFTGILSLYSAIFNNQGNQDNQDNQNDCLLNNVLDVNSEDTLNNYLTPNKNIKNRLFDESIDNGYIINFIKFIQPLGTASSEDINTKIAQTESPLDETVQAENTSVNYTDLQNENGLKDISTSKVLPLTLDTSKTITNIEPIIDEFLNIDSVVGEHQIDLSIHSHNTDLLVESLVTDNDHNLTNSIEINQINNGINMQVNENLKEIESLSKYSFSRIEPAAITNHTTTTNTDLANKVEIDINNLSSEKIINPNKDIDFHSISRHNGNKAKIDLITEKGKENNISADIIPDRGKFEIMNINETNPNQIPRPSLINQIAERIDIYSKDGKSIIKMRLVPDSLGSIEIETIIKENSIQLNIIAERSETNKLLFNKTNELNALLSEKGFKVEHINVSGKTDSYTNNLNEGGYREGFGNRDANQKQNNAFLYDMTTSSSTVKENEPVIVRSHNGSINIYI